ncbi:hypothetical protein [Thalassiella azotivora]
MDIPKDPSQLPGEDTLRPQTFTGSVVEGVEHGSVVLEGEDGVVYQLGGAHRQLVGRRVCVTGRRRDDVMTLQQQGVLLAVHEVTDLGEGRVPPRSV